MLSDLSPQELREQSWRESSLLWIHDNGILNEKGHRLLFKDRPFLKDVYDDWTPIQTARKASQLGYSTMVVIKTLLAAKQRGYNTIYTLPTAQDVSNFVPSKVNAIIDKNPTMRDWTKDKDSVSQKRVGDGFIYYRGTFSNRSVDDTMNATVGIMLSSDINVHDECDRSDQTIIEQYTSRLDASDYKGRWLFSNPSVPNTVSDKLYQESDQKHWFHKCPHCNHWQYLDFWENIIDNQYVCSKCKKALSDDDRRAGRWVKKYNGRSVSGYWLSHLICPWIPASQLVLNEKNKPKQYFYNFDLGLPYVGSEARVSKELILKNIDDSEPNFAEDNTMGIDVGFKKHYVIGNKQGVFRVGTFEDWDDARRLMREYDIRMCVIDAMPDITEPRRLIKEFPGKVFISWFKESNRSIDHITVDRDNHEIFSDRSQLLSQVIEDEVDGKIRYQMDARDLELYSAHWLCAFKTKKTDPRLKAEIEYWDSAGEDHFIFATLYWWLSNRMGGGDLGIFDWKKQEQPDHDLAPDVLELTKHLDRHI